LSGANFQNGQAGDAARQPIRVMMVHYRDSAIVGGSLRVGETIANHVDPNRIAAEMVFAYGSPGPVSRHARVPCHFLRSRGPKDFRAWIRAREFFRETRPDIIHFQDAVVWLRTALAGTPYLKVVHVHGRYQVRPNTGKAPEGRTHPLNASRLLRTVLKFTDAQVCINNGARDALLELGWIRPERSYVVYNGLDVSRFAALPDRVKARTELGLPTDALLLGMICRLVWEKGCADLFSIIERLPDRWHGVICGDGPQKQELQRECEVRGLVNRIHFIGARDDVIPVYAALDAYAFLSHYEAFGLVLAEAMAAGVPIFGIQSDGEFNEPDYPLFSNDIVEMLPFQRAGNYEAAVPPRTLDHLAVKLSHYGSRPECYRGMIARARTRVGACFDARIQAEAITRVYENIFRGGDSAQALLAKSYQTNREQAEMSLTASHGGESEIAIA
jgi:glycosyltransferase involved in cell wall biosynthesis